MKSRFLIAVLLMLAGLQTIWAQSVIVKMKDGRTVVYSVADLNDIHYNSSNGVEAHEWVDLGLPSGTLWATMNVGAEGPEQFGDYFAWGETTPIGDEFGWGFYKYCKGTDNTMTKYCTDGEYGFNGFTDGLTELLPEDDAASVNWGEGCQMPSMAQCYELISDAYTTIEEIRVNGVRMDKITSLINGNYIFLPNAGYYNIYSGEYEPYCGFYGSRSLSLDTSSRAFGMYFDGRDIMPTTPYRCDGLPVRPVQKLNKEIVHVTNVVLNETSLVIDVGDEVQLTATVEPSNATFPTVIWESSGVIVSPAGKVKAYRSGTATVTCRSTDDLAVLATCQITVRPEHDYVDLGLPSGTLWATTNVGADEPEQYGDYFAWGETQPKETYSWGTYELCLGGYSTSLTKYVCDEWHGDTGFMDMLTELEPEDDAATANWGNKWQMPSDEQLWELYDNKYTTTMWITQNGVAGRKITSKINGNSIFLPAAGIHLGSLENSGTNGYYWSRTIDYSMSCYAASLHVYQGGIETMSENRYEGRSVRPVRVEKVEREQHEYVDLSLPSGTLWATCNIGANSPEERGDRFAWAETETKDEYSNDNYKYGGYLQLEKYCTNWEYGTPDGATVLEMMDDAAIVNWGPDWQTPSQSQFEELINSEYTTAEPTTQGGVNGWRITSKRNGNSIFLPSTTSDSSLNKGTYWSRNLYVYDDMAWTLTFDANNIQTDYHDRSSGEFVRPVRYKDPILVSKIELNHTELVLDLNDTETLTATVLPENADNKNVIWSVSDEDVIYFQDETWVVPQSPGTCTISCRSTDGSNVYAECHITVLPQ